MTQPEAFKGTISLANPTLSLDWDHTLVFKLVSTTPGSSVTVSNLMQYYYSALPVFGGAKTRSRR